MSNCSQCGRFYDTGTAVGRCNACLANGFNMMNPPMDPYKTLTNPNIHSCNSEVIARLEAENNRYRTALENISKREYDEDVHTAISIAKDALEG